MKPSATLKMLAAAVLVNASLAGAALASDAPSAEAEAKAAGQVHTPGLLTAEQRERRRAEGRTLGPRARTPEKPWQLDRARAGGKAHKPRVAPEFKGDITRLDAIRHTVKIFDAMDANGDGVLTAEERQEWAKKHPRHHAGKHAPHAGHGHSKHGHHHKHGHNRDGKHGHHKHPGKKPAEKPTAQ